MWQNESDKIQRKNYEKHEAAKAESTLCILQTNLAVFYSG